MEKEKREAHRKECVCVCVQMRAFRVAVMASGGCAFRERISRPLFIGSDDERSQPSFITAQWNFFFFVSSLKELNFLKLRDFSVGILSILICIFSDILWPVLCGSQTLQEAAHLHGEDHWFVQGQETTRSASARLRHHRFGLQVHVARYVVVVVVVGSFIFWLSLGRQGKKRENIKAALPFACSFWGNVKPGHIWWRWSPG